MSIFSILSSREADVPSPGRLQWHARRGPSVRPNGPAQPAPRPQRRLWMPSTWSRMREPPSWCSAAGREYRRPSAGGLQVCSSACAHGSCMQTRRPVARAPCALSYTFSAPDAPLAMSRSMPPLRASSVVESRCLPHRRKNRCPRRVLMAVDGGLLQSMAYDPCTAFEANG